MNSRFNINDRVRITQDLSPKYHSNIAEKIGTIVDTYYTGKLLYFGVRFEEFANPKSKKGLFWFKPHQLTLVPKGVVSLDSMSQQLNSSLNSLGEALVSGFQSLSHLLEGNEFSAGKVYFNPTKGTTCMKFSEKGEVIKVKTKKVEGSSNKLEEFDVYIGISLCYLKYLCNTSGEYHRRLRKEIETFTGIVTVGQTVLQRTKLNKQVFEYIVMNQIKAVSGMEYTEIEAILRAAWMSAKNTDKFRPDHRIEEPEEKAIQPKRKTLKDFIDTDCPEVWEV